MNLAHYISLVRSSLHIYCTSTYKRHKSLLGKSSLTSDAVKHRLRQADGCAAETFLIIRADGFYQIHHSHRQTVQYSYYFSCQQYHQLFHCQATGHIGDIEKNSAVCKLPVNLKFVSPKSLSIRLQIYKPQQYVNHIDKLAKEYGLNVLDR